MKIPNEKLKRVRAGFQLLLEPTVSLRNFENIRTLLKGINPAIDEKLEICLQTLHKIQKLHAGEFSILSLEALPEKTEEQKKRKKLVLFFIVSLNNLKGEVQRVEGLLSKENIPGSPSKTMTWVKIFGFAKGPVGVITLIAIGLVLLQLNQVEIMISNIGCAPIQPVLPIGIQIPGILIPHAPIPPSGSAVIKMPPLTLAVDNTSPDTIKLKILGMNYPFAINNPSMRLTFDGTSLNGVTTSIALGQKKLHTLLVQCK